MENQKPDYCINKKRKVIDFLVGFWGVLLSSTIIIVIALGQLSWSSIAVALCVSLILEVPVALVLVSFRLLEADSKRKYLAIGVLVIIGCAISYAIAAATNIYWGVAYAMLLAGIMLIRNRQSVRDRENISIMALGLVGGGLVWKTMEIARNGAIYPILAAEWLVAAVAGIFSKKRIATFALAISTVIFLWFTALTNPCSFSSTLHW